MHATPAAKPTARNFHPASLDAVNFLLADVRGALGPYLNVFLVTREHWSQADVGLVTMFGGLLGIAAQTPIGALIDETRAKRAVVIAALVVLALGAAVIFAAPTFWPVMIANGAITTVGDVFAPAIAALTLGLYARRELARRMGRNSAFDHAGNVGIALSAAAIGSLFSQRAVFLLVPAFALLAGLAVLSIPAGSIDHDRARDMDAERDAATGRRAARPRRPVQVGAALHIRSLHHPVPLRQRAHAAAGGAKARRKASGRGDGNDVGLHHRRATGDAADRHPRRAQG